MLEARSNEAVLVENFPSVVEGGTSISGVSTTVGRFSSFWGRIDFEVVEVEDGLSESISGSLETVGRTSTLIGRIPDLLVVGKAEEVEGSMVVGSGVAGAGGGVTRTLEVVKSSSSSWHFFPEPSRILPRNI